MALLFHCRRRVYVDDNVDNPGIVRITCVHSLCAQNEIANDCRVSNLRLEELDNALRRCDAVGPEGYLQPEPRVAAHEAIIVRQGQHRACADRVAVDSRNCNVRQDENAREEVLDVDEKIDSCVHGSGIGTRGRDRKLLLIWRHLRRTLHPVEIKTCAKMFLVIVASDGDKNDRSLHTVLNYIQCCIVIANKAIVNQVAVVLEIFKEEVAKRVEMRRNMI